MLLVLQPTGLPRMDHILHSEPPCLSLLRMSHMQSALLSQLALQCTLSLRSSLSRRGAQAQTCALKGAVFNTLLCSWLLGC